jgi:hypothetical protein
MKKMSLLLVLFCNMTAFAQKGFFLQPEIGFGTTTAHAPGLPTKKHILPLNATVNRPLFDMPVLVGYSFRHWEIKSGITLMTFGYSDSYKSIDPKNPANWASFREEQHFAHLMVPFIADYRFSLSDRMFISPGLGFEFSHTFVSYLELQETHSSAAGTKTFSARAKYNDYSPVNLWGTLEATVGYKVSDRLSIVATPALHSMLSSTRGKNFETNGHHNHVSVLNVGVKWCLSKNRAKDQTRKSKNAEVKE